MKIVSAFFLVAVLFFITNGCTSKKPSANCDVTTPSQAIERLKEGNVRFVSGKSVHPNRDLDHVVSLAEGQSPYVAIVACSDSRVPVELIFDQGFGDLFVIRTAGNSVMDCLTRGSVDYAVTHLGVKAVVVLGHTGCGAIKGVVGSGAHADEHAGEAPDGEVSVMLNIIAKNIEEYKGRSDLLDEATKANVDAQVARIKQAVHIKDRVTSNSLLVIPAIYDVASGKVRFL